MSPLNMMKKGIKFEKFEGMLMEVWRKSLPSVTMMRDI